LSHIADGSFTRMIYDHINLFTYY